MRARRPLCLVVRQIMIDRRLDHWFATGVAAPPPIAPAMIRLLESYGAVTAGDRRWRLPDGSWLTLTYSQTPDRPTMAAARWWHRYVPVAFAATGEHLHPRQRASPGARVPPALNRQLPYAPWDREIYAVVNARGSGQVEASTCRWLSTTTSSSA